MMKWQKELAGNVRDVQGLLAYMDMNELEQAQMAEILARYPLSVTAYYLGLIDWNDPGDPIRKMAIPSIAETDLSGSFDTSGEAENTVVEGLQHKYAQTALLLFTNQCAMYCRHCFRKRLVGLAEGEVAKNFGQMREYIQNHTEISNVLVSGGDALLNSNARLDEILGMLADIEHLDAIRIATRVPVVFPARILADEELQCMLEKYTKKKQIFVVTQFNHPRELTKQAVAAGQCLLRLGIPVKNQTVLLKGVNDSPAVLGALLRALVAAGIAPYYVFQCRPVTGVKSQFQVPLRRGAQIVQQARAMQNGLGKAFCYCMSHVTGKVEIMGEDVDGKMLFRYHEARDEADFGRLFVRDVGAEQTWLEEDVF